jgi:rhamnose transport system ATP-binding protein
VLIADEPTRGVDVGAKRAIYELLATLTEGGLGVLLISSDVEEILGLAHRVLVMRAGQVAVELTGAGMTEAAILGAAFGADARASRRDTVPTGDTQDPDGPYPPEEVPE